MRVVIEPVFQLRRRHVQRTGQGSDKDKRSDKQTNIEMEATQQVQPCRARGGCHTFPFKAKRVAVRRLILKGKKRQPRRARFRARESSASALIPGEKPAGECAAGAWRRTAPARKEPGTWANSARNSHTSAWSSGISCPVCVAPSVLCIIAILCPGICAMLADELSIIMAWCMPGMALMGSLQGDGMRGHHDQQDRQQRQPGARCRLLKTVTDHRPSV